MKPYIFSVLPSGSVPASLKDGGGVPGTSFIPTAVIEIRSSISLIASQTLPAPFKPQAAAAPFTNHIARLLTPSPSSKSPLYVVTTPSDRATATAEGSTVWSFVMKAWGEQVDELVQEGAYANALALLESLDPAVLSDKVSSRNALYHKANTYLRSSGFQTARRTSSLRRLAFPLGAIR